MQVVTAGSNSLFDFHNKPLINILEQIKQPEQFAFFKNNPDKLIQLMQQQNFVPDAQFFEELLQWGMQEHAADIFAFMIAIADLTNLKTISQLENLSTDAKKSSNLYQLPLEESTSYGLLETIENNLKKVFQAPLQFIPSLLNIFLGAFDLLNAPKRYMSLWDKNVLLDVIYKFFKIPYHLAQTIQSMFVVTARVYLIGVSAIFTSGVAFIFFKTVNPRPYVLVGCNRVDGKETKIGQPKAIKDIIAALLMGLNPVIIGPSGEGKTSLVKYLVQLKNEGCLPKLIADMDFHELDCMAMTSSMSFGCGELLASLREQTRGHENGLCLVFDDIYELLRKSDAYGALKANFLTDELERPRFLATMTIDNYQAMLKTDTDGSFERRFFPILLNEMDVSHNQSFNQANKSSRSSSAIQIGSEDEHVELVLNELIKREGGQIPICAEAIARILEICKENKSFLTKNGVNSKAMRLLAVAIGLCKFSYESTFSIQLQKLQASKNCQISRLNRSVISLADENQIALNNKINRQINELEEELARQKITVARINDLLSQCHTLKITYFNLSHALAKNVTLSEAEQKMYLLYKICNNKMKAYVSNYIDKHHSVDFPLQVDVALINHVFAQHMHIQERLNPQV